MTIPLTGEPTPLKPLRLWPGIVLVALLLLTRFDLKLAFPGIKGFGFAVMGSLGIALAVVVWWAFFSRATRAERWGGIAVMAATMGVTWLLKHDSMWLPWLFAYAIPGLCFAFVAWAVATRRLPVELRRATMIAIILLACGAWLFVRQDGINGDHNADFGWRWAASTEERLLAQASDEPQSVAVTPTAETPVAPIAGQPAASPSATVATEVSNDQKANSASPAKVENQIAWPGFRGSKRDGIVAA